MKGTVFILIATLVLFVVTSQGQKLGRSEYKAKKLSSMAKNWAHYLASANVIQHRPQSGRMSYGENIYWHTNVRANVKIEAKKVVMMWYDEIKDYSYDHPYFQSNTAHFTQVVWKTTQYVGCGWAHNPYYKILVVVCNYWKQGNMQYQFRANVLRKRY